METRGLQEFSVWPRASCGDHLEPMESMEQDLAPYLSTLSGTNLCEEFDKLADLVLSGPASPSTTVASPSGHLSDYSSATNSPYSSCVSNYSSPPPSTSCYSYPTSVASSTCGDETDTGESSSGYRSPRSSASGSQSSSASGNNSHRKQRNATAAERYRRKLKGRRSNLCEQLEQQLERNMELRQKIRSKLSLYGEFVDLLARNTHEHNSELAALGARSLGEVLTNVISSLGDGEQTELFARYFARFERIRRRQFVATC